MLPAGAMKDMHYASRTGMVDGEATYGPAVPFKGIVQDDDLNEYDVSQEQLTIAKSIFTFTAVPFRIRSGCRAWTKRTPPRAGKCGPCPILLPWLAAGAFTRCCCNTHGVLYGGSLAFDGQEALIKQFGEIDRNVEIGLRST